MKKVVRQIFDNTIDKKNFKIMTEWMYNWWEIEERYTFEEVECYMSHCLQKKITTNLWHIKNSRIQRLYILKLK